MISLIVPTLGERDKEIKRLFQSLNRQTYKNFEVIVVSQDNHEKVESFFNDVNFKYQHIKINKKGLSVARNAAIKKVRGDILTFSDDDCWYKEDSMKFINEFFKSNKSQIAVFQHFDPDTKKYPKNYPAEAKNNISKKRILNQSSIDIFINTQIVSDYVIGFDERFGVGSKYNSGEENIYLMDLYKKGYRIDYYPEIVSYHPTKFDGIRSLEFYSVVSKAPLFKRLFGPSLGIFVYVAFLAKKRKIIDKKLHCFSKGLKEYLDFQTK